MAWPFPPINFRVTGDEDTRTLTWNSVDGALSYLIWFGHQYSGINEIDEVSSTSTTYTHYQTLTNGTWDYFVSAVYPQGSSNWSTIAQITISGQPVSVPPPPHVVFIDIVTLNTTHDRRLVWPFPADGDGGSPITGYRIRRRPVNGNWTILVSDSGTSERNYTDTDTDLVVGTTYEYQIANINALGVGPFSASVTVGISARLTPTDGPSGISAELISPGEIRFRWDEEPSGFGDGSITDYRVQFRDASERIAHIEVTNGGSGYTSDPTVTIDGGGGSGATIDVDTGIGGNNQVNHINVSEFPYWRNWASNTDPRMGGTGSGYTSVPTITISGGGGSGATAEAILNGQIYGISPLGHSSIGSGYTSAPNVEIIGGGGSGATATATVIPPGGLRHIEVTSRGSGYQYTPTVTISGGGGSGATATVTMAGDVVSFITITNHGSGYVSSPSVSIDGGGYTQRAYANASISDGIVNSVTMTNRGSGYTEYPSSISFTGGGGTGGEIPGHNITDGGPVAIPGGLWGLIGRANLFRRYYGRGDASRTHTTEREYTSIAWKSPADNGRYQFRVAAVIQPAGGGNEFGDTWSAPFDFVIIGDTQEEMRLVQAPNAPTRLTTNSQSDGVVMTWDPPSITATTPVDGYEIWRFDGTSWNLIYFFEDTTTQIYTDRTPLTAHQSYEYAIRAYNAAGEGPWSEVAKVRIDMAVPSASERLSARTVSTGVQLQWEEPENDGGSPITSYEIWRFFADTWFHLDTTNNANTVYVDTENLIRNETYEYSVRAVNANGIGAWSQVASINIRQIRPSPPRQLVGQYDPDVGVVLSWLQPLQSGASSVSGYEIRRYASGGNGWSTVADGVAGATTTYTDNTVVAGMSYQYTLRAENAAGKGDWSETTTVVLPEAVDASLAAPENVQAIIGEDGEVQLTWNDPNNSSIDHYQVRFRRHLRIWSRWIDIPNSSASTTSHTITGLAYERDQLYGFSVRATGMKGPGFASSEVRSRATTTDPDPDPSTTDTVVDELAEGSPTAPRRLTTSAGSSSVVLNWEEPTHSDAGEITGYEIWRSDGRTWTKVDTTDTDDTTYTDMYTLASGESQDYMVRAVASSGPGEWSNSSSAVNTSTGTYGAPSAPRALAVYDIKGVGVVITWYVPNTDGGSSITAYEVQRHDGNSWTSLTTNISGSATRYVDIDTLTAGDTYEYIVRAINAAGNGEWSQSVKETIGPDVPSPPRQLTGDSQSDGVVLTWLIPSDQGASSITQYIVYRHDGTSYSQIATTTDTTYTDTSELDESSRHHYGVRARNATGIGEWSNTISVNISSETPSEPRRLTADSQSTGVVLDWSSPLSSGTGGPVTRYQVARHDGDSWTIIVEDTGNATTGYTDTDTLEDGKRYKYSVRAGNVVGFGEWSAVVGARINSGVPSAPRRVALAEDASGIRISWLPPLDSGLGGAITGYGIWRKAYGSDGWIEVIADTGNTNTHYTDTTMLAGGWHYWAVRARNAQGLGEWSQAPGLSVSDTDPSQPTSVTATYIPASTGVTAGVQLRWDAPANDGGSPITSYGIWRATDNGSGTGVGWLRIGSPTTTSYKDVSILGNGVYFYRIRAITAIGYGDFSAAVPVQVGEAEQDPTPSAPRRFIADAQSTGVVMSWTHPASPGSGGSVSGYEISRSDGGSWSVIANIGPDNVYTDTANLTVNATYFYVIRARNASGTGEQSGTATVIINPSVPSAPRQLVVNEIDDGIKLDWLEPVDSGLGGDITGYQIWRQSGAGIFGKIADIGVSLTYTDTSTLDMGWYWYTVRAVNSSGEGEWSETSGVTTAENVPGPPQSLIATQVDGGIKLMWEAPSSNGGAAILGYRVWRSDGGAWAQLVATTGNPETEYTDAGVSISGTNVYFYRVQAITANGVGDFSAVALVQFTFTVRGTTITFPVRSDNRVFGGWWVYVDPLVTNPDNNILTYEWSQTGGVTINSEDTRRTYIRFPDGTDEDQGVSITLKVTNTISNKVFEKTDDFIVVAEPDSRSLFHVNATSEVPGIAWYDWTQPHRYLDETGNSTTTVGLVDSRRYETRAHIPIVGEYVQTMPAYVGTLVMRENGNIGFQIAGASDDPSHGASSGPQLTDDSETNLGLALRLPDGTQYKWAFNQLTMSDDDEPYEFSAASVNSAGQTNSISFRNKLYSFWNLRMVLVDRTNTFIDWNALETIAVDPTVSIDVIDTTADSGKKQTISGTFDDFRDPFEDIELTISASSGTLGELNRDNSSGFWSIVWTAPTVASGTQTSTISISATNALNRTVSDSDTITTRSVFTPVFPDNLTTKNVIELTPEDRLRDLTNIVNVPVRQFSITDSMELWNMKEAVELLPGESKVFVINYPDDEAPRSHLAVNNWEPLKLAEDPEYVFGPSRNTFGVEEGELQDARLERDNYAKDNSEWFEMYKNSSSSFVRLLCNNRSGAAYEAFVGGIWHTIEPIFPDYAANSQSDGNGNDRTNDLEFEIDDGGNTRKIIAKNTNLDDPIFLVTLRCRGRVIQEIQKNTVEIRDEPSIESYGEKDYGSESQFLSTLDHAHEYGTHILYLYAQPQLKIQTRININDNLFLAYSLRLSDRITLTRKGDTADYFIECIEHDIQPGFRHDMILTLSPAPAKHVIVLGSGPVLGTGVLGR